MIPVRLDIHNFMCYQNSATSLDFGGIQLACLSGDNGNGKSAIIDAITWALWGKARTNSDDELIYIGQAEMKVEFDFRLEKELFRIVRRRSRPKRPGGAGQSSLEFQVHTEAGFRSITSNTLSQTQQEIIKRLHMDYETFINSAYLRQGHADEFTIKRPAERKEVLSNILGLSVYEELEEQARELVKNREFKRAQLETSIEDIDKELSLKPSCVTELEQKQSELSQIEAIAKEKESGFNEFKQKRESLQSKKSQLDEIQSRIENTAQDLERWHEQGKQHRARIQEYEKVIEGRTDIERGYTEFVKYRKLNDDLYEKSQNSSKLEKRKAQLEARISDASRALTSEHAVLQSKIDQFSAKSQKLPDLKKQLAQVKTKIHELEEQTIIASNNKETVQKLHSQVSYLESEIIKLESEIKELREKLDLLSTQTETTCPLCETELSKEGLERIEKKYLKDIEDKTGLLETKKTELQQKKAGLSSSQEESNRLESQLNQEKTSAQSQAGIIGREILETEDAEKQLAELKNELGIVEQRLVTRDFALNEQEALEAIEAELSGLDYDVEKHEQARKQMNLLEKYDNDKRKLDEAERFIRQEQEAVRRADEATTGLQHSLEQDNHRKEGLNTELAELPGILEELTRAETEYRAITGQRNQAQESIGQVKAKLQRLSELETTRSETEQKLNRASKDENIYRELARAFGKGGIQAMLIETAFPEVEAEANQLLSRMTDNRMHVKFETQRETKKGSTIETLDINISDELGTRNYEMFSGGEAFRINFAIRIALSRLLAKRAGAPLRTLIIDEGFGTQDSTGLEKLKEAIISIQQDFDMILVITHVEEFRDAFPTRIDVTKTPEGSKINVN